MSKGLTGIPSLAYLGVNAGSPPNIKMYTRSPIPNDSQNFIIGDLWINTTPVPPTLREIWMLVALLGGSATWVRLYPGAGGGGGNLRSDDLNISVPDIFGAINVWGGNIHTAPWSIPSDTNIFTIRNPDDNTLKIMLKRSIMQPNTNATATEGMYFLGGLNYMHNYGVNNTWMGHGSANLALTATNCVGVGTNALHVVNTGGSNSAYGSGALVTITDGIWNLGLGRNAGSLLAAIASNNIMISSPGVVTDNNTTRIGTEGVGAGQVNRAFMAGIWNAIAVPGKDFGLVFVDEDGKLYKDDIGPDAVVMTNAGGQPIGVKGAPGTVLTGRGINPADPAPQFLAPYSPDLSVLIGVDGVTGQLTFIAAPAGGGVATFTTDDALVVVPDAGHNVNVLGSGLINTTGAVANTITLHLTRSTMIPGLHAEVVSGMGPGGESIYKELWSGDGSIAFDLLTDPTKIDIRSVGGGGGMTGLKADGIPIVLVAGQVNLTSGKNILLVPGIGEIEVNVTDNVYLLGWLHAEDDVQTIHGHIMLPDTNALGTEGTIIFGGNRWIHNFGNNNTFIGARSGNNTLTVPSAVGNTATGLATLESLSVGAYNSAYGFDSSSKITSGSLNSSYGHVTLNQLVTGSYNAVFGYGSGSNYTGAESSNLLLHSAGIVGDNNTIRIGNNGIGDAQQDKCYIAGIYNKVPGPASEMVVIGSNHKLGTAGIPGGGAMIFNTDANPANVQGVTIDIEGGLNINTTGAGHTVTIHLDKSVMQPTTNVTGTEGVYALGHSGFADYSTYRFMHNWGSAGLVSFNTYLGYWAGHIDVGATGANNTGIGTAALRNYTTAANCVAVGKSCLEDNLTGHRNTCIGVDSGRLVTSATDCILVGYQAGNIYTLAPNSHNIIVGSGANVADLRTMRLGYYTVWNTPLPTEHVPNPVETKTTTGTNNAYMYGIYKEQVTYSGTPVYVDHTGKLGTTGSILFAFRQTTALPNATGDGTVYVFGTSGGLTVDFDSSQGVYFTDGGGVAPARFTAPNVGTYVFTASITMSIPASPPVPRPVAIDPLYVITDNLSYSYSNYMPASTTFIQYVSEIVTTTVFLNAGQHVYWACAAGIATQAKNISIVASQNAIIPSGIGVKTFYTTYFTGYRVS